MKNSKKIFFSKKLKLFLFFVLKNSTYVFLVGMISPFLITRVQASVGAQKYKFNPNLTYEFIESSNLYDPYLGYLYPRLFTVGYNYIESPFVVQQEGSNAKLTTVLKSIQSLQLGYHQQFSSNEKLSMGIRASIDHSQKYYDPSSERIDKGKSTSLGDSYINLKYQFYESENWINSVVVDLGLGTGNKEYYLSDGNTGSVIGVVEYLGTRYRISGNLGYRYAPDAKFQTLDESQKIQSGVGGFYSFNRIFGGTLEVKKDFSLKKSSSQGSEVRLGLQKKIVNEGWTVFGSLGTGNVSSLFSKNENGSDYRLAFGVKFTPEFKTADNIILKTNTLSLNEGSEYKKFADKLTEKNEVVTRHEYLMKHQIVRKNIIKYKKELQSVKIHSSEKDRVCEFYSKLKNEFPQKIYFDFNSDLIKETETVKLKRAIVFIKKYRDNIDYVRVSGYTDSRGSDEYNLKLSKRRALATVAYLNGKTKKSMKFKYEGLGKQSRKFVKAQTKKEHARDRRTEVKIEYDMKSNELACLDEDGLVNQNWSIEKSSEVKIKNLTGLTKINTAGRSLHEN